MFERENAFYKAHKDEFHQKYLDKWLVITGETLWGVYDKSAVAAKEALQHFKPGEFIIHKPFHDGMVIEIGPRIRTRYSDDNKRPKAQSTMTNTEGDPVTFTYAY